MARYKTGIVPEGINDLMDAFDKMFSVNDAHGFGWEIKCLLGYRDALFAQCPVQPGDTAELIEDQNIPQASGWWPWRHSFREGARVFVKYTDWTPLRNGGGGHFIAAIQFEIEISDSYKDGTTVTRAGKGVFLVPAAWLCAAVVRTEEV